MSDANHHFFLHGRLWREQAWEEIEEEGAWTRATLPYQDEPERLTGASPTRSWPGDGSRIAIRAVWDTSVRHKNLTALPVVKERI